MKDNELSKKIENLRSKMNCLIDIYGEKSDIVLECSQELDKLIFISYNLKSSKIKNEKSANYALVV